MTEVTKEPDSVPPLDEDDDLPLTSKIAAAKDAKQNGAIKEEQTKSDKMEDDDDDIPLSVLAKSKATPTKRKLVVDDEDEPTEPTKSEEKKDSKAPPKKQATGTPSKKTSSTPAKKDEKKPTSTSQKDSDKSKVDKSKASDKEPKKEPEKPKSDKKEASKATEKEGDKSKSDKKEAPKKSDEKTSVKKEPTKSTSAPKKEAKPTESNDGEAQKEGTASKETPAAKDVKHEDEEPKKAEQTKPKTPEKKASAPAKKETPKRKAEAAPKKSPAKRKKKESSSESESSSSSSSSSSSESSSSESESSSSESGSDSDDDVPISKLKEKAKKKNEAKKKDTKKAPAKPKKETKSTPKKKPKKEEDGGSPEKKSKKKKEEDEMPEYKWWLEDPLPEGKKWKTLQHNGVLFPPPYVPHGVKLLYEGEPVELNKEQEELATYYAQYIETDHVTKPQFRSNFWKEFQKVLKQHKSSASSKISDLAKCDFRPIHKHLMDQREARKNRSKEEKQKEKDEKDKIQEKYGVAIVDGHKQKIGNYKIEPPGLFLGRGDHPKAGMLKKRIMPEDVTLNLSKEADIPECPVPGHKWGGIEHNDEVSWLAFWKDSITGSFKYVWLAPSSRIKGEADMRKFETARKLKKHIGKIREKYTDELQAKDTATKQRATALYVIDHLALRVGNEKDEDEADTVGCCSLRVEHIKLKDPNIIEFDFLGKDSMRYQNAVSVDEVVFKNFKSFIKHKKPDDEIFDELTTSSLNNYLKSQMEGLTAKVFRTYNASITLESELEKQPNEDMTVDEKMLFYNRANREVAILCNHQRTVSKSFGEQMGKIDEKIKELEDEKQKLKDRLKRAQKGEKLKDESESDSDKDSKDKEEKKKKKLPTDPDKIKNAISRLETSLLKWKTKKTEKDELKEVSLTTSKINYIDPRISVAWAKKNDVPLERIFSKTLRQKFPWAMDVGTDYRF